SSGNGGGKYSVVRNAGSETAGRVCADGNRDAAACSGTACSVTLSRNYGDCGIGCERKWIEKHTWGGSRNVDARERLRSSGQTHSAATRWSDDRSHTDRRLSV